VWLKIWVPHPSERTLNPTSGTQPIREGIGLQDTIKLKKEEILERQQRETGMLES
jgi:hypothetical protein